MRRIFSITTIAAVIWPLVSPLVAAATCPHVQHAPACHRAQEAQPAHHCDAMMHEHQTGPAAERSEAPALKAINSPGNCPMDCCVARHITNAAAVADASPLPPVAVTERNSSVVPVTFTSTGFSSHTDRGPPNA